MKVLSVPDFTSELSSKMTNLVPSMSAIEASFKRSNE
jgi:hypothetical protein